MKSPSTSSRFLLLLLLLVVVTQSYVVITTEAQQCKPNGVLRGKAPPGQCNNENDSECCERGKLYPTFKCSPPFNSNGKAKAKLTLNSFEEGGDGGGASKCDGKFHSDDTPVVALSTGWLQGEGTDRCNKKIKIEANGKSVVAKVVDECDSAHGCDDEHSFQPPCSNNIVDGSRAVWEALGIPKDQQGELNVVWSDA